jgi:hypothetical protein
MGVIYAGKASIVHDGTSARKFDQMTLTVDGDVVDTSNYTDAGFLSNIDGNSWATADVEGPYDSGVMTYTRGAQLTWTFTVGGSIAFAWPMRLKTWKLMSKYKGTDPTRVSLSLVSNGAVAITLL